MSKRVAVIRGGPSEEYAVSMQTGTSVLGALRDSEYVVKDVVISKRGEWLDRGIVRTPEAILGDVDVAFLALHGTFGEDGMIQRRLDQYGIRYTGSRAFASTMALNKDFTKQQLRVLGVAMPQHYTVIRDEVTDPLTVAKTIMQQFPGPYVLKPIASGSSLGTQIIRDAAALPFAITHALIDYDRIMVEEYIQGREATCGLVEGFRDDPWYVLPAIEIIADSDFFDFDAKYSGKTREECPGNFSKKEKEQLAEITRLVHQHLGLRQYSRSDFIIRDGTPYFLEVNTLPGLTKESLFPKAVEAVGARYLDLISHLIETA